jgi:hypothetical protein
MVTHTGYLQSKLDIVVEEFTHIPCVAGVRRGLVMEMTVQLLVGILVDVPPHVADFGPEFLLWPIPALSLPVPQDELPICHTTESHILDLCEMHPGWAVPVISISRNPSLSIISTYLTVMKNKPVSLVESVECIGHHSNCITKSFKQCMVKIQEMN